VDHADFTEPEAKLGGDFAVAGQAEGAEVFEVALAAALGDGTDVVGVPEGASAGDGFHAVERKAGGAGCAFRSLQSFVDGDGVGAAEGADPAVAGEDVVAEVAGIGAQTPLVDAVVGAEGTAAAGEDFELAPAAEGKAVGAGGEFAASGAAAGEGAGEGHRYSG